MYTLQHSSPLLSQYNKHTQHFCFFVAIFGYTFSEEKLKRERIQEREEEREKKILDF
jgi:hypothetical protein